MNINNPWFIGIVFFIMSAIVAVVVAIKFPSQSNYNLTINQIIYTQANNPGQSQIYSGEPGSPFEWFSKIGNRIGDEGSIAIQMKGLDANGREIEIIPLIGHDEYKLRLFIDKDQKLKFFVKTPEIMHTLEASNLKATFDPSRYHLVLLQWSKDFIAIQIDGMVVARIENTGKTN